MGRSFISVFQLKLVGISIQLLSPTSGEGEFRQLRQEIENRISIQLLSPTSGEQQYQIEDILLCVDFPFNCFPQRVGRVSKHSRYRKPIKTFSIQLLSPTSGEVVGRATSEICIPFPFNCFPQRVGSAQILRGSAGVLSGVSIQLLSPTSGEVPSYEMYKAGQSVAKDLVSIQLLSPTSGETQKSVIRVSAVDTFPFNCFPQRVGRAILKNIADLIRRFHSTAFPNEWGGIYNIQKVS